LKEGEREKSNAVYTLFKLEGKMKRKRRRRKKKEERERMV